MREINNKVWFVTELYWPSSTSTGFILTKIAESITVGREVAVVTGPPSYENKVEKYNLYELRQGVEINRVKVGHFSKDKLLWRFLRLTVITAKLARRCIKLIESNATIIVVTTPFTLVFLGAVLKRFKKKSRLIVIVHDIYPDNLVIVGLLKNGGVLQKILDKIFFFSMSKMDVIVALGRDMQRVLEDKGHKSVRVVENWAESHVLSEPSEPILDKEREKTVFLFAGNIGRLQGIDRLLEAIEILATQPISQSLKFVFAGGGAMEGEVKKREKSLTEGLVRFIGPYERSSQREVLTNCDVGVVSLDTGMFGLGVPSKAYNIMAAGKPIFYIGDPGSELDLVIKESDCGWFAEATSAEDIAIEIEKIASLNCTEMHAKAVNSFTLGSVVYTEQRAVAAYQALVSE